jgi:small GTP-binding protein
VLKVISVGDGAVGKSSIALRFSEDKFGEEYLSTIGIGFAVKTLRVETPMGGKVVKLQIWDTGGQDRFACVRVGYYKGAAGGIIVFDLTNEESFNSLPKWVDEVRTNGGKIPLVLVGNKADLPNHAVETSRATRFAEENGMAYAEASAKTGTGVNEAFSVLVQSILASFAQHGGDPRS